MRGRRELIVDRTGAIHVIEAIVSAFLVLSCITCLNAVIPGSSGNGDADLIVMSSDLLHILQYRENRPGHPGLAPALYSPEAWAEQSAAIEADMSGLLPPGIRACMVTPCGKAGDFPPDGAITYSRPFLAYRQDTHEAMDCKLILWRG